MTSSRFRDDHPAIALACGAVFLSAAAPWVRLADVGATVAAFYRMVVGAAVLFALCSATGRRLWSGGRYTLRLLPVAALFALDLSIWHRSIERVGPGLATILANMQVFAMAGAGIVLYGERPEWRLGVGLGLAVPGLWLLVDVDVAPSSEGYAAGIALGLGAAVAYTAYLLTLRRAQGVDDSLSPHANLAWMSAWCALLLGGAAWLEGAAFGIPDVESGLALGAYGLFTQVFAWILITGAMPRLPASLVGLLLLLQPALAMVWDVLFFSRPPRVADLAGGALVLAGLYLGSTAETKPDV
ncbi:MAG: DMT family transporter [Bradymonadaceae bacterium]